MKILKLVIYTIIVLVSLVIASFIISPIYNNIWLSHLSVQLRKYPLPEQSEYIEQGSVCGKLNGNGNGMNFFSCILIKSDLSLDEIQEHYNKKTYKSIDKNYVVEAEVMPANGYRLETKYLEHRNIYFEKLKEQKNYFGYYVVMIYDGGYWGGLDIRAN